MATQFVLSIEHILDNIFDNFAGDIPTSLHGFFIIQSTPSAKFREDEQIRRRTLASAALTCKAFSEPASKVIWTSLHRTGLEPLVKLYWDMKATAPKGVHSAAGLSQRQWERWDHIAARVRCIVYDADRYDLHSAKNSVYLLRTLQARYAKTERALFPKLRTLVWSTEGSPEDEDWLEVFFSPSAPVSSVYFQLAQSQPRFQPVPWRDHLGAFVDRYRHSLRKLGCSVTRDINSLVSMLPLLLDLQQVEIDYFGPAILASLSVLPKLVVLTVLDINNVNICQLPGSKAVLLHALQELHLPSVDSEDLVPLFDCLSCPRLRMLSADLDINTNFENAERKLQQISTHPLVRQLTMLDLHLHWIPAVDDLPLSSIIASLLSLHVRQLSVTMLEFESTPICPTPQDLERIARAWPLLSSLKIAFQGSYMSPNSRSSRPPSPLSTPPSLSAVLTFVLACPVLRVLQLELIQDVSAEELATAEETLRPDKSQLNLEYLELARIRYERQVTIADPARLARMLRAVFPHLRSVRCPDPFGPGILVTLGWLPLKDGVVTDYDRLADCFDGLRRGTHA